MNITRVESQREERVASVSVSQNVEVKTSTSEASIMIPNENSNTQNTDSSQSDLRNAPIGVVSHDGIFFAMGLFLFNQGILSMCYHKCPTNLTIQFDTTMIYMMCTLALVKIFQFRNPGEKLT